jgi:hypothetical protein
MERVLAIDPGERVGWARAELCPEGALKLLSPVGFRLPGIDAATLVQGVTPLKDFALKLGAVIGEYDTVVYETWRLYPHKAKALVGNDMQPSQLVGIIRYLAWMNPKVKLVSQGANIKDMADRAYGAWLAPRFALSTEEHDKDALRHLVWYWHARYAGELAGDSHDTEDLKVGGAA